MKKLLITCRQNRNRSPIASRILTHKANKRGYCLDVSSAGYNLAASRPLDDELNKMLIRRGYGTLADYNPQALTQDMIDSANLVLCMSPRQIDDLCGLFPNSEGKIMTLPQYASRNSEPNAIIVDPNRLILNVVRPGDNARYASQARVAHALPRFIARLYLHHFANGRVANTDLKAVRKLREEMILQIEKYVSMAIPRLIEEGYLVKRE